MQENASSGNAYLDVTDQQRGAIDLLVVGKSYSVVASEIGVDESTLWRWRQDATFAAAANMRRRVVWSSNVEALRSLITDAIAVVRDALQDDDIRIRLQAARTILSTVKELEPVGSESAARVECEAKKAEPTALDLLMLDEAWSTMGPEKAKKRRKSTYGR